MSEQEDLFKGYGIQINLKAPFHYVRDALSRIGIANHTNKVLTQSCHIFHKRGQYAIMHFKEMFLFDGKPAEFSETDEGRRNRIVEMLKSWDLIEVLDNFTEEDVVSPPYCVSVLSKKQVREEEWTLVQKYTLGRSSNA